MSYENKIKYEQRYAKKYCTKEQLKKLVVLNALTVEEYKEITGEEFIVTELGGE